MEKHSFISRKLRDKYFPRAKTRYNEEVPQQIVYYMSKGLGVAELCNTLGILPSTLFVWMKEYEEVAKAIKNGEILAKGWWERQARINVHNAGFNNSLFTMVMQNRFDWSKGSTLTIKDARGPKDLETFSKKQIGSNRKSNDELEELDVEQLEAIEAILGSPKQSPESSKGEETVSEEKPVPLHQDALEVRRTRRVCRRVAHTDDLQTSGSSS